MSEPPTPVEVQYFWSQVAADVDKAEKLMMGVFGKIEWMKRYVAAGLLTMEEVERASRWHGIHCMAWRRHSAEWIDGNEGGAGI